LPALTSSANTGASLYFGAAAGAAVADGDVAVGTTGAVVAGIVGAAVGVAAGAHAERIVDRIKIQPTALARVVLVFEGFICILLLMRNIPFSETNLPFVPTHLRAPKHNQN
jgi:ABC-type dipeptide/oligopeptide/nickel transport system permease subunit